MANTFDQLNASNYVINTGNNIQEVPSINFNIQNGTLEELTAEVGRYDAKVIDYKQSYFDAMNGKTYITEMFAKDLAASAEYLTEKGINKQMNKISLHAKADNIFQVALEGNNLFNSNGVQSVKERYQNINEQIALDDDGVNSAFVELYGAEETYDTKAKEITVAGLSLTGAFFLNDAANAFGNERTFTNYITEEESSSIEGQERIECVNTPEYQISFMESYTVNEENTIENVWVIKAYDEPEQVLAYTENSIDDNEIEWTMVE